MIMRHLYGKSILLNSILSNLWRKNIYYVTDRSKWSFYWDAYYITSGLKKRCGLKSFIIHNPWGLKNQIIQFGDRYAYLNGPFQHLHSSNFVFLTWFHGDTADPNPTIQYIFSVLPKAAEYLEKIVVSCRISREILVEIGIPEEKLITIPLGVDLTRFFQPSEETRLGIRNSFGILENVICIGSFQKDGAGWGDGADPKFVKGPDVFLEVVANLSARYNNLQVLLTGPARGYIKEGLKKIGIPYVHHFLNDYHDIVRYYQALDIYIITSRSEGGPKALLESWATGIPVVSTRVGMSADLIKHGKNGMLADIGDIKGVTDFVMELIEDPSLHKNCRLQALEDVKQHDWLFVAECYYKELYKPLIG